MNIKFKVEPAQPVVREEDRVLILKLRTHGDESVALLDVKYADSWWTLLRIDKGGLSRSTGVGEILGLPLNELGRIKLSEGK